MQGRLLLPRRSEDAILTTKNQITKRDVRYHNEKKYS
jgi:hypothetical protein